MDTPQYQYRLNTFDFDVIMYRWGVSLSPGNERVLLGQRRSIAGWHAQLCGRAKPGGRRADRTMTREHERDAFVQAVRALDRVLLWGHHFVPLYHITRPVAYWDSSVGRRSHPSTES